MKHTNLIEFINENIENHGAKEFFNIVQNNFFSISEDIKQCILNEVEKQIKPDKIKTIEDLAKLLDGNEYGYELKNKNNINVEEFCKQNNWVVVFPYSDDNVELCGAIDDEIGAWNGTILKYVVKGEFYLEDCDEYGSSDPDIYYKKAQENMFVNISESELKDIKKNCLNWKEYNGVIIEALWSPKDIDASWQINAVGCANSVKFNIMEDGELYAECVVIDLNNIN